MHPISDVDAILLLATTLSSKRRPAELVEIMAAAELLQIETPFEAKLPEAFHRLSTHGLIVEVDGRFALTPAAETLMSGLSRKTTETAERIFHVRDQLSMHQAKADQPAIVISEEQLAEATLASQAAAKAAKKNVLVPKPKPAEEAKRPGLRQRKPMPKGRRKF